MKSFSILLAALILFLLAFSNNPGIAKKSNLNFEVKNDTLIPSLADVNGKMSFDLDDDTYVKLIIEKGVLKSLKINGQLIDPAQYKNHRRIFDWIEKEMAQHKKDMAQHELDMAQHELDMKQHEEDMKQHELDMKQYEEDMKQHEIEMQQIEADQMQYELDMKQHEEDMKQHEEDMKQHALDLKKHEEEMKLHESMMVEIKELLKNEKFHFNGNNFNIQISDESTIINGIKVSKELHEKIKKINNRIFDKQ
ncbi:MAG: hypothetical protein RLZZ546_2371 [Bacteroidota bacterium]|jgi:chromosome segregation ATPase